MCISVAAEKTKALVFGGKVASATAAKSWVEISVSRGGPELGEAGGLVVFVDRVMVRAGCGEIVVLESFVVHQVGWSVREWS